MKKVNEITFKKYLKGKNLYELKGEYLGRVNKIEMFCHHQDVFGNTHGTYFANPVDIMHSKTCYCPKCGGTHKMTTKEFIVKANYIHNNYFLYDKTEYKGANEKIVVTCPIHGDFEVKANNHLNGANCKQCQLEKRQHQINKLPKVNAATVKLTQEQVIERIKKYHSDYGFDKLKYVNYRIPIILTCPIHGDFSIAPSKALIGRGCRHCARNMPKNTEIFIKESKEIHQEGTFDYSMCEYKSIHTKVTLKCNKCGAIFKVEPSNHLTYKHGCPCCKISKLEREIKILLEANNINFIQQKQFDWLGRQSLDFYLPQYNIAIECQGIQHFEPCEFFGGEKKFNKNIENDKKKFHLCNENNIKLLYYSNLKVDNENIITDKEVLLKQILSESKNESN